METDQELLISLLEKRQLSYELNSDNLPLIETEDYLIHSIGTYTLNGNFVLLSKQLLQPYREKNLEDNSKLLDEIFSSGSLEFKLKIE
jgi:hypothetical protein